MKGHDITVVFDGWKSGGAREETLRTGGIAVIYSRLGENADFVIKRIIANEKKEWVVVTSDREIASFAWARGAVAVPSGRFLPILMTTGAAVTDGLETPVEDEDADDWKTKTKGGSRTPSKREKALARVMKKL